MVVIKRTFGLVVANAGMLGDLSQSNHIDVGKSFARKRIGSIRILVSHIGKGELWFAVKFFSATHDWANAIICVWKRFNQASGMIRYCRGVF